MKKRMALFLAVLIAAGSFTCLSYGASSARFVARVNGETDAQVDIDGEAVVTMTIETNDSYTFYSMQDYVKFDPDYFELDESSISVKQTVSLGENVDLFSYSPIKTKGVYDRVFVNRASLSGLDFEAEEVVLTFTLKPLKEGQTEIAHYRTEMLDENSVRYTVSEVDASVVIGDYEEPAEETTEPSTEETTDSASETTTAATDSSGGGSSGGGSSGGGAGSSSTTHTVTFVVNDSTSTTTVTNGNTLEEPDDPVVSGYTFEGWYIDTTYTTKYDFTAAVTSSFTLYAKMTAEGSDDTASVTTDGTEEEADSLFSDVGSSDWFYDAVKYVSDKGLMVGVSDDEFAPKLPLTRGMFITVLYRIEGSPEETEEASFEDVFEGDWYYEAVKWGDKYDIIYGYSAEEYGPNDRITREQMAAIIYRYAAYKGTDTAIDGEADYIDSGSISNYARPAVKWISDVGFMQGDPDGSFRPLDNASRAETAQVIMNVVEDWGKE